MLAIAMCHHLLVEHLFTLSLAELASLMKLKDSWARWGESRLPLTPASSLEPGSALCSVEPAAPGRLPCSPTASPSSDSASTAAAFSWVPCCMGSVHRAGAQNTRRLLLPKRLQAPGPQSPCLSDGNQFTEQETLPTELTGAASEETSQGP